MVAKKLETKHECGLDRKLCMYLPCIARRTKKSKFLQGAGPGQQAGLAEANELLSLAYSLAHVLVCYVGAASIIPLQQHQESNLSHQPHSASSCRRICTPPTAPVTEAESSGGAGACFLLSLIVSSIHSSRVGVSEL